MKATISLETLISILLFIFLISLLSIYYQNFLTQRSSEIISYENKIQDLDTLHRSIK
ncbi:MAG: hypothetical protein QW038_00600 [Nanopusillaceae archaeon]